MIRLHLESRTEVEVTPATPQPWMDDRNCKDVDPDMFFEVVRETKVIEHPSRKYCRPCVVRHDCLIFAMMRENPKNDRYGYIADTSPSERDKLYELLTGKKKDDE